MKSDFVKTLTLALAFAAVFFSFPARAQAPDPAAAQVQTFCDTLLDSMKHAKELGIKGRYDKLKPVIEQVFDLPGMTAASVGLSWPTVPAAQQHALIAALTRMTVAQYANNFDGYDGEKFVVDSNMQARGADKYVHTELVTAKMTVPFDYRMRQSDGTWKVIDVLTNGEISSLATQRSDFAATLASGGPAALENQLNAKADSLMK